MEQLHSTMQVMYSAEARAHQASSLQTTLLVGWELTLYLGNTFWFNAFCVALGEAVVLLTLGRILWAVIQKNGLQHRLFGDCTH